MLSLEAIYVGIGGTGGSIIKSQDRFFHNKRYLYLDKGADLQYGYDELAGIERNIYNKQNLPSYFSNENRYILFLGLGGKTGSYIITEILDYLHTNNIEHQCYCFYPYHFEPKSRIFIADEALVSLERYQNVTILNMDEMKKRFQNLSLASPFWIPNDILIEEYIRVD
ncbi:hypothetical protein ABTW24_05505 [Sphingobacterium thalpophilum]|uniref:Uncharacterized protein n=1 Tax=Sphingobacterium thalpophilum TaxID=259 RepID=A0ABV4H977_9SPHI